MTTRSTTQTASSADSTPGAAARGGGSDGRRRRRGAARGRRSRRRGRTSTSRKGLWLRWISASALGGVVLAHVARRVSMAAGGAVGDALGPVAAETAVGALALGGMMAGLSVGQWLVIRQHVSWAPRLALGTVAGGVAGGGSGFGVLQWLTPVVGAGPAVSAAIVVGLAAFGTMAWLVLRGQVPAARRLAVVSVAGVVAAVVATGLSGIALGELAGGGAGGGVFGAVHAAVTGSVAITWAMENEPRGS